jgi:hypothetical protein
MSDTNLKGFHNMELHVIVKDQYGCVVYVPNNAAAKALAEIAGTKTLTPRVLRLAKGMGYKIKGTPQCFTSHLGCTSNSNYVPIELAL